MEGSLHPNPPFILGNEHCCILGLMRRVPRGTKLA
jgi:hypothetical protein